MKKIAAFLLVFLLTACAGAGDTTETEAISSAMTLDILTVTGDVSQPVYLDSFEEDINVIEVLAEAEPRGDDLFVVFAAKDGVMAEIPYAELEAAILTHSETDGWTIRSEAHPPQSGVRELRHIVVRATRLQPEQSCVRILQERELLKTWSFGDLFMESGKGVVIEEGTAVKNDRTTTAYTQRKLIPLADYVSENLSLQLYTADGQIREVASTGFLEWRGNEADYLSEDLKTRYAQVTGVWAKAPALRIDHIADRVKKEVETGPVLMVLFDGLGALQYEKEAEALAFLHTADSYEIASTTMPSVSSVALASLLTGQLPANNGVMAERIRRVEGDDLFTALAHKNKNAIIIEGNTKLIDFSQEQRLHADENQSGTMDDEVWEGAMQAIEEGPDFLFVHFHGYDDLAHTYGPHSLEALGQLATIDEYIAALHNAHGGRLIVTADHGQHDITGDKLGEHGEFVPSDMLIPVLEWRR